LDLAEYLARKNSEEEERQEIADFLRDWTPEKYPVDDAVTVATAREVSGLNGGGNGASSAGDSGGSKFENQVKSAKERLDAAQREADIATLKEKEWRDKGHTGCEQCQGDLDRAKLARNRLEAAKKEYEECLKQLEKEQAEKARQQAEEEAKKKAKAENLARERAEAEEEPGIIPRALAAVGSFILDWMPQGKAIKLAKTTLDVGRAVASALGAVDTIQQLADHNSEATPKPSSVERSGASANAPKKPEKDPEDPKKTDKDKKKKSNADEDSEVKKVVHFGQNPNQSHHTFRHTEDHGLRKKQVKSAIEQDLGKNMQKFNLEKSHKGTVKVDGIKLEYNAHEIAPGEINIGKITVKENKK
jgi:hypothetical protein